MTKLWAGRAPSFVVALGLLLSLGVYGSPQVTQATADPDLVSVVPARVLETRIGQGFETVDGQFEGIGVRSAGSTTELVVAGRAGVPGDADAVWINLTAVEPSTAGYVTVYPCGESRPLASSLNVRPGKVTPNAVLAKVGEGGRICIYTSAAVDMVADINGYVPQGATPKTVSPARLLDTRNGPGYKTVDGDFEGGGIRAAGTTLRLTVTDRGGVDGDADAVLVNLTAVEPVDRGFITVYPCGSP
ncbi:MAG: hypothetical protein GXP35_09945, partial [Actinobacteria bacterium]|nr:hypothetical protein [Actinomycetota bacterium]